MSTNLISTVAQIITPDLVTRIAAAVGLDKSLIDRAMSAGVLVVHLLTFVFVGLLPLIFFVRGQSTWRWWLTGAPFFVCALALAAVLADLVVPALAVGRWRPVLDVVSVVFATSSIALVGFTLGTHRIPIAL